jgi:hypothetical protein
MSPVSWQRQFSQNEVAGIGFEVAGIDPFSGKNRVF